MLKIRLQRIGKRGQAYFKVVVIEHTRKPKGDYLELLGSYDPHKNEVTVDAERVKYWLSQGVQMSPTVNNLLVGHKVIEGKKVQAWKSKPSSQAKTGEKKEAPKDKVADQSATEPRTETPPTVVENSADDAGDAPVEEKPKETEPKNDEADQEAAPTV